MTITIVNDCRDDNAVARQISRTQTLFERTPSFIGVANDLEAAGNLVDVLDATGGAKGVILVNVAPRQGVGHRWENGTPFGYFRSGDTLVFTSVDGRMLPLVKKFGIADSVFIVDTSSAAKVLEQAGLLSATRAKYAPRSQFRSFDFLPFAARHIYEGGELPGELWSIKELPDPPLAVWWVDSFGNSKTTALPRDVDFAEGKLIDLTCGSVLCIERLRDVPDGEAAMIVGSSGFNGERFLELVVQGGNAAERLSLRSGSALL